MQLEKSPGQEHCYGKIIVAQVMDSGVRWIRRRVLRLVQHMQLAGIIALVANEGSHLSHGGNRKPCRRTNLALCCQYPLYFADLRRSIA